MDNDRVMRRAAFNLKETGDGSGIQGVSCQAVDGFGGQSDYFALA
jgi:hypothetical protein